MNDLLLKLKYYRNNYWHPSNVNNMFSIRAGYPGIGKKDAIEGLSFGVGVKYPIMNSSNKLSVDYTSSDFGPLGIVQRVSLGFNY